MAIHPREFKLELGKIEHDETDSKKRVESATQ